MISPVDFLRKYQNLRVEVVADDKEKMFCGKIEYNICLRNYFMMNWTPGTEERKDFNVVTKGIRGDRWFQENKNRILNAAMGKGAPRDYELALEWAVRAKKIKEVNQNTIQKYCDDHLGIDCSGFVTNYLIASKKMSYTDNAVRNTSAASYYNPGKSVNDPSKVKQGDLLVWMDGNSVMRNPGHVALVDWYIPQSRLNGNMRVVEATGAKNANPKILDSLYGVEQIINKESDVPVMILVVNRHRTSGSRVAVIRF